MRPFQRLRETRTDQPINPYTKIATATLEGRSREMDRMVSFSNIPIIKSTPE